MSKKITFYLTSFMCGLCVMGVEMSATRLLSPYFGSTNLIWTVIICLIMVGLGGGSYLGGRLADKYRKGSILYGCIAAAAIWIALLPLLSGFVIDGALSITKNMVENGFLVSAIISAVILFVPPLLLLGMVSPYLAKLCVDDLDKTGIVLGKLSVFNTVGSILGSVLPAFVLIPTIGVKRSFLLFSFLLVIVCIAYWLMDRKDRLRGAKSAAMIVPIIVASAFTTPGLSFSKPTYETESMYSYIKVDDYANATVLSTGLNNVVQTIQAKDPDVMLGIYTDALIALPTVFGEQAEPTRVLQIGYGGGTVARGLRHFFGDKVDLTCVELDEKIVEVARMYFDVGSDDEVVIDDGRAYLQGTDETFDIIIVDAYQDAGIPLNLTTQEFYRQCESHLSDSGFMVINLSAGFDPEAPFTRSLGNTIGSVFDTVRYVPIPDGISALIFGSRQEIPFAETLAMFDIMDYPLALKSPLWNLVHASTEIPEGGELFTDDLNNAELLQLDAISRAMERQL